MKRFIDVHREEIATGRGEVILKSDSHNGACLVIVAHDAVKKIGCLAHARFLSSGLGKKWDFTQVKEATDAIDEMIKDMILLGSNRNDIEISLVTGENVPHEEHDPEYENNLASALELLEQKHIRCKRDIARDVGNSHIKLDVESGDISYV